MEATSSISNAEPRISNMGRPIEILIPEPLQNKLNLNLLAQQVRSQQIEIAQLQREILLKERYIDVYQFAANAHINLEQYTIVDEQGKPLKFVLKENRNDRSPTD